MATSDNLEQVIIVGHGALRESAESFKAEVKAANVQIGELISRHNLTAPKVRIGDVINLREGEKS